MIIAYKNHQLLPNLIHCLILHSPKLKSANNFNNTLKSSKFYSCTALVLSNELNSEEVDDFYKQ